jgi:hypothetical protein
LNVRGKGDTIEAVDRHAFAGLCLLCACAGCENPGLDEGAATLVLLETHPGSGASGSPIAGPIRMTFNEPIERASAAGAFSLVDGGGRAVFGTLTVQGREVRFDPELPLRLSETYRAEVTPGIRGENGASLDAAAEWSFSTIGGELGPARKIGTIDSHYNDFQMSVTIDEQARPWAVWLEDVATFSDPVIVPQPQAIVVAVQGADRSSWQSSHRFEAPSVETALAFSCLLWDGQHNGYLVWQERVTGEDRIQLARFDPEREKWGAPETVVKSTHELAYPRCGLDSSAPQSRLGLQVVWLERGAKNEIRRRVLDVAEGRWLEPAALVGDGSDTKILASVGLQRAGPETRLYFATETLSTILLRVATLEDGALRDEKLVTGLPPKVEALQLGTNRNGAAFLLWEDQSDTSTTSLWAVSRGPDKSSWSSPVKLVERPRAQTIEGSQISVDAAGDAFVSWREADGSSWKVYHARYQRASNRWGDPALFQSVDSGFHASGIAAGGPMIIVVSSEATADSVWHSEQQTPSGPWTKPAELSRHENKVVFPPANLVTMPTGQLAAFWYERVRHTRDVGGVLLAYYSFDLWGVVYQAEGS